MTQFVKYVDRTGFAYEVERFSSTEESFRRLGCIALDGVLADGSITSTLFFNLLENNPAALTELGFDEFSIEVNKRHTEFIKRPLKTAFFGTATNGDNPDYMTVVSGSRVSRIVDKSGFERHAIQNTTSNQPVYNPNISASYAIPRTGGEDVYPISVSGGAIGTPGTLPSGFGTFGQGTLERTIVQLPSGGIIVRYNGTTSTTTVEIQALTTPVGSVNTGDIFYHRYRLALTSGGLTNINAIRTYISERNASDGSVALATTPDIKANLTANLQEFEAQRTTTNAAVSRCKGGVRIDFASGVNVDFTLYYEPIEDRVVKPATLPSNTVIENIGNLAVTNVGQNVTSGQAWTDFRIAGTTSTTSVTIALPFSNADTLRAGDVVDAIAAIALAGGALTNIDAIKVGVRTNTSAMTIISTASGADIKASLTSSLQDFASAEIRTTATATNRARLFVILEFASAVAIDVTLRIAPKVIRRNNTVQFSGVPYIFFDSNSSHRMRFGSNGTLVTFGGCNFFAGASDRWTVFMVMQAINTGGIGHYLTRSNAGAANTRTFGYLTNQPSAKNTVRFRGTVNEDTFNQFENHIVAWRWDGNTLNQFVNGGTAQALDVGTAADDGSTIALGTREGNVNYGTFYFFKLACCERALEPYEINASRQYLAENVGISLT